jgi:RNA polymerase sigma factor (sigma-70 family)
MSLSMAGEKSPHGKSSPAVGSFEALYRAEISGVMSFFARRMKDAQAVFDLTSDTFLEALRSFGSAPPARGSERPWLLTIARRVYAQHCDGAARRRDLADREHARRVLDIDETEEIEQRIDAEQLGRELLARLDELSQHDRDAIELVDLAGLTPREAAKTVGVSAGSMRVRLFRARGHLRKGD